MGRSRAKPFNYGPQVRRFQIPTVPVYGRSFEAIPNKEPSIPDINLSDIEEEIEINAGEQTEDEYDDENVEDDDEAVPIEEDGTIGGECTDDDSNEGDNADSINGISQQLKHVLAQKFNIGGAFSAFSRYTSAPNPCLLLDGFGTVGLPLSDSIAVELSKIFQTTRSKRKKDIQKNCEIATCNVTFQNSSWSQWIKEAVVPQVCKTLGVNENPTDIGVALSKVALCRSGANIIDGDSIKQGSREFATLMVMLPSYFTGGPILFEHGGNSSTVDMSTMSESSVRVVAWYQDIHHQAEAIRSGSCIALFYTLRCNLRTSAVPHPVSDSPKARQLRQIFAQWKSQKSPRCVVYLFHRHYDKTDVLSAVLKHSDGDIIRKIQAAAEPLGFRIYLAKIYLVGRGYSHDTIKDYQIDDWELGAENLIDLNGRPVDGELNINRSNLIPYNLSDCRPDTVDDDDYTDITLYTSRTGVIMWPEERDADNMGKDIVAFSSNYLGTTDSTIPTPSEALLIERLLSTLPKLNESEQEMAFRLIRRVSLQWNDPKLWLNCCNLASIDTKIGLAGVVNLVEDLEFFGFTSVGSFFDLAVVNGRDSDRFELVDQIYSLSERISDKTLGQWAIERRAQIFRSLKQPDSFSVPYILDEIKQQGYSFLIEVVTASLEKVHTSYEFWEPFLLGIENLRGELPGLQSTTSQYLETLLQASIQGTIPFPRSSKTSFRERFGAPNIDVWMKPITTCLSLQCPLVLSHYFTRMENELAGMSPDEQVWAGNTFFPAAAKAVSVSTLILSGESKEAFSPFWQLALTSQIRTAESSASKINQKLVFLALDSGGYCDSLQSKLLNESGLSAPKSQCLQRFALILRKYITNLENTNPKDDRPEKLNILTSAIATHIAQLSPLNKVPARSTGGKQPMWSKDPSPSVALALIGFIISTCTSSLQTFLIRLSEHKTGKGRYLQYLEDTLLPVLTALIKHFKTLQNPWPFEPVSGFATQVIKRLGFYTKDMTVVPPKNLQDFGCSCEQCGKIKNFFVNSETRLEINAPTVRNHLVSFLQISQASSVGFKWTTGPSQILQIDKSTEYIKRYGPAARRIKGVEILAMLGEPSVQQQILGAEWTKYRDMFCTNNNTVNSNAQPTAATSKALSVSAAASASQVIKKTTKNTSSVQRNPNIALPPTRNLGKRSHLDAIGSNRETASSSKKPKTSKLPIEVIDLSD